jgi:hydantoinase/carbamoylase family amidase
MSSLAADLDEVARIGADNGGVSRFAWTPELAAANEWLVERLTELDLTAEVDAAGNVLGRWEEGEGPAVLVGSHLDTVPKGGRYDGALGVLAALDVVRRLKDEGASLRRPLWVVSFNDEEGSRFQTGMLGSRAFVGDLDLEDWRRRGVADAMKAGGFDFARLPDARAVDGVGWYLELHIEQGPVLEQEGMDLGIVTAIAGLLGFRVRLGGEANHAGTTPMAARRDALVGAARIVLALRDEARGRGDMTANVGLLEIAPGGFNVIPGTAEFTVDVRAGEPDAYDRVERFARETFERVASEEGLEFEVAVTHRKPPTPLDAELLGLLETAAEEEGATVRRLPSGAGHDAMVLAQHVPAAMLFVPSRAGISHSPEEFTPPEQCELGARTLAGAVRHLVT